MENQDPKPVIKNTESKAGIKEGMAWTLGIGLAIGTLIVLQFVFSDNPNAYIGVFVLIFCVLPVIVFAIITSLTLGVMAPRKAAQLLAVIWLPSIVVLCATTPFFIYAQDARQTAVEKEQVAISRAIGPGEIQFIALSREGLPADQIDSSWIFKLESTLQLAKSTDYSNRPTQSYDGYQLTGNNKITAAAHTYPESQLKKSFSVPKTDYSAIEPFVRLDGGAATPSPSAAWLWPKQVDTMVYVYKDHVETAPVINHLEKKQQVHATMVKLTNLTGKDLMRVKVNGWNLPDQYIRRSISCESDEERYIPAIIGQSILIEWQVDGDETWHSATSNALPAEPKLTTGQFRRSQGVEILLGQDKTMAIRRKVTFDIQENEDMNEPGELIGQEQPSFSQFNQNYIGCTPKDKGWPRALMVYNLTTRRLKDMDGRFGTILAGRREGPERNSITNVFEQSFYGYKLKPNIQLKLQDKDPAIAPRKITIPIPDYSKMKQLIAQYPEKLTPSDFRLEVFVYPDAVESAYVLARNARSNDGDFMEFRVTNQTGRTIARLQINDVEIAQAHDSEYAFLCGETPYRTSIPSLLDNNRVRWQYVGSREWHSADIAAKKIMAATLPSKSSILMPNLYLRDDAQLLFLVQYGVDKEGYLNCKESSCAGADPSEKEAKAFLLNAKECTYEDNDNN
jgi:hypothetical protein